MFARSISVAGGLALFLGLNNASPVLRSTALYQADTEGTGTYLWISNATATMFGQDATRFDYYLASDPSAASSAMDAFANAISSGDEHAQVIAFLNATQAGTLTAENAASDAWLCSELSDAMASRVSFCQNASERDAGLEARGRWNWIQSNRHHSTAVAVGVLSNILTETGKTVFNAAPRAFCNVADSVNACLSWSAVESFNHAYGQAFVQDAINSVDLNSYSAQANGVLTNQRKRAAADVCVSNRADGCT